MGLTLLPGLTRLPRADPAVGAGAPTPVRPRRTQGKNGPPRLRPSSAGALTADRHGAFTATRSGRWHGKAARPLRRRTGAGASTAKHSGRLHADRPQPLRRRNAPAACTATERGRLSGEKLRLLSRRTSGPAATAPPYGRASPRSRWPPWRRAPSSLRRGCRG